MLAGVSLSQSSGSEVGQSGQLFLHLLVDSQKFLSDLADLSSDSFVLGTVSLLNRGDLFFDGSNASLSRLSSGGLASLDFLKGLSLVLVGSGVERFNLLLLGVSGGGSVGDLVRDVLLEIFLALAGDRLGLLNAFHFSGEVGLRGSDGLIELASAVAASDGGESALVRGLVLGDGFVDFAVFFLEVLLLVGEHNQGVLGLLHHAFVLLLVVAAVLGLPPGQEPHLAGRLALVLDFHPEVHLGLSAESGDLAGAVTDLLVPASVLVEDLVVDVVADVLDVDLKLLVLPLGLLGAVLVSLRLPDLFTAHHLHVRVHPADFLDVVGEVSLSELDVQSSNRHCLKKIFLIIILPCAPSR